MTFPISSALLQDIAVDCLKRLPEEACGLVVNGVVVPCKNIHSSPLTNFAISPEDYAKAEDLGDVELVYHSHVGGECKFSSHDIKACKQSNLPWLIYHATSGNHIYADPRGTAPFVGRQWSYGIHDCYGLMRDFYLQEFDIELDDFERGEEMEWEKGGWSMFADNWKAQGFYEIEEPQRRGDVAFMQIDAPSINHAGIFAGDSNLFYHHLMGRLSELSVWGSFWRKATVKFIRHKEA